MAEARRLAADYRRATGKPLPISGEIAVHDVMRLMKLKPAEASAVGYDAIGTGPREGMRIQIKGRAILGEQLGNQRLGQLKMEQDWDSIMLVLMDENYEPTEIYEADRQEITEDMKKDSARNKRGAMSVIKFTIIGRLVWNRVEGVIDDEVWDNQAP
jgi:hypothetical protein